MNNNKTLVLVLAAALSLLLSCRDRMDIRQLTFIENGLRSTNRQIKEENLMIYSTLSEKLSDPYTHTQATYWKPAADSIKHMSDRLDIHLDSIIGVLKGRSQQENINADNLFDSLATFKTRLFTLFDTTQIPFTRIADDLRTFEKEVPLLSGYTRGKNQEEYNHSRQLWRESLFDQKDLQLLVPVLMLIKNDIAQTEHYLIKYCDKHVQDIFCGYAKYEPVVSINSRIVKAGEPIEITAGMGYFITRNTKITINGSLKAIPPGGIAIDSIKTTGLKGTQYIPIEIDIRLPDGTIQPFKKSLEFFVKE